jgi:hypothetical protein
MSENIEKQVSELNTEEKVLALVQPIVPGVKYYENWVLSSIELPEVDLPKIVFVLKNEESGKEVRLEMTTWDQKQPCYDHSRSFSFAFASEGESTLSLEEEKAMVAIIDAVIKNDRGRMAVRYNDEKKIVIVEVPPPPGLWNKFISRIKGKGENQKEV